MDQKVILKAVPAPFVKPTKEEAEAAVRVLLSWAGDDPNREGLLDTPRRVTKAFKEYFKGYDQDPADALSKTFFEVSGYDDMVMLRGIPFSSHCEHHIAPFHGVVHVAYLPNGSVVGISKLARVVDIFAKRLQTQETMTAQIAKAICENLGTRGVAGIHPRQAQDDSAAGGIGDLSAHQSGVATLRHHCNSGCRTGS